MNNDTQLDVKETLERVTRIESRLVQLGDHVGANLRTKQRIDIAKHDGLAVSIIIDSLDVSLSRIYTELAAIQWKGHPPTYPIEVYHHTKRVMTVYPK